MNAFSWLLRRELWENRAAWIAPAATAAILVLIAIAGMFNGVNASFPADLTAELNSESLNPSNVAVAGLGGIAAGFFLVLQIGQYSYLVDCLYAERKDRSILFWKSLPTSDAATVLSKLVFALLVMPAIAALAVLMAQVLIYLLVSVKFSSTAGLLATMWSPAVWGKATGFALYVLLLVELWALPLMAWVLLVSAYAPRSPMLMALLVPLCAAMIEKLLLGSSHVLHTVVGRMGLPHASTGPLISPEKIDWDVTMDFSVLATPELWLGLLVAAGFVWAAIEIRRRRDPAV